MKQRQQFDVRNQGAISLHVQGDGWSCFTDGRTVLGEPGARMKCLREESVRHSGGDGLDLVYRDDETGLEAVNHIRFFGEYSISRRWVTVRNVDAQPRTLDTLHSAFIDNLPWESPDQYCVHIPYNHSYAEAQWRTSRLSGLGLVKTLRRHASHVIIGATGRSGQVHVPMAMLEDRLNRGTWIWQIEHSGAWMWDLGEGRDVLSLGIGGLSERHNHWFKILKPGESVDSLPVSVGWVEGDADQALSALADYRRQVCVKPHPVDATLPVIFNDYMNCLMGKPDEAKSLRLIPRAAAAGCEIYVMDAGWFGAQGWGDVGDWHEDAGKFPNGLKRVMDAVRQAGMIPGLWIEIEAVARQVELARKPDDWFISLRGQRHVHGDRYALDFRNPAVRRFADETLDRLIRDYGLGYIKFDYNLTIGLGPDSLADSPGDGALAHCRAVQQWFADLRARYPLVIMENCASGGLRSDYALLSIMQLASSSDQTDYRNYPALTVGGLAALLPEQLGIWSYPKVGEDREAAIFNMVNALLARIHQSGQIADIDGEQFEVIREGIALYRSAIRADIPVSVPVWPLGRVPIERTDSFQAVGLRVAQAGRAWLAVWRLDTQETEVRIPLRRLISGKPRVEQVFPSSPWRSYKVRSGGLHVTFPAPYTAALFRLQG